MARLGKGLLISAALLVCGGGSLRAEDLKSLEGTWLMDAAYEIHADGVLSYAVPANASGSGTTAYSIWRRASQ